MGFEYDIFISYAREDDLPVPSGGDGWVTRFHKDLEFRLRRRFGKLHPPRIWRDQQGLAENQPIRAEIRACLERSMLFLALHSTNYSNSESCREEWEWFYRRASELPVGRYLPANRSRLLNVLLRNIEPNFWPREFRECVAFRLCDSDTAGHLGDPTEPDKDWQRFDTQMKRLVDAIEKIILTQLQPRGDAARAPDEPPAPEPEGLDAAPPKAAEVPASVPAGTGVPDVRPAVFIAHVSDTLRSTRRRLVAELGRQGVSVLAPLPPPFEAEPEHRDRLRAALAGTALSVHLLDRYSGTEVPGEPERTYPQVQAEAVLESAVPQLVWLPDRAEIEAAEAEDQRQLLQQLDREPRLAKRYRFLCGHREDLARLVVDELAQIRPPSRPAAEFDVLIDAENQDRRYGALLMAYLEDQRVPCLLHQEHHHAVEQVDEFDENLGLVRALVILFGQAEPELIARRLERSARRRLEARGGGEIRLHHFSVFLPRGSRAHPAQLERDWGWLNIRILDNRHSDQIDPQVVRPLLELTHTS